MAEVVTFDGNNLANVSGLVITGVDPHRPSARNLNTFDLVSADLSSVPSAYYKSRSIHVMATIAQSSKANLQTSLRTLESYLQTVEGLLVVPVAGVSTQFIATKDNIMANYLGGGLAELDIEFRCSNPMGYAVSSTTLYNYPALVGGAYSFAVTWLGNVRQQPVITITYATLTADSSNIVSIANPTRSETLSIRRNWSDGDVLVVNCKTKTVTVNGANVDYSGKIPEWTATQPINYSDDFTARNMAVNLAYQVRNL